MVDKMSNENFHSRANNIWFEIKRLDLRACATESNPNKKIKCVTINPDLDGDTVRSLLREEFQIENHKIIRVRNKNGSLIPIGSSMAVNRQSNPFILEVVEMYQRVRPSPRTAKMSKYNETMKKKLDSILYRLICLEKASPDLCLKRNSRIKAEVDDLDHKLLFLNKRFDQAECTSWKGMFKKYPLW